MKEACQSPGATKLLTAAELAPMLGVSVDHLWAMARRGELPCVRLGHSVRFDPDIIARLTEQAYSRYQKQVEKSAEDQAPEDLDNRRYGVNGIIQDYPRPTRRPRTARSSDGKPETMREVVKRRVAEGKPPGEPWSAVRAAKRIQADLERQKAG